MKTFPFLPWHNVILLVLLCLAQWRMLMEPTSPRLKVSTVLPYFRSYCMVLSEMGIRLSTILPLQDTVVKESCELDTPILKLSNRSTHLWFLLCVGYKDIWDCVHT